MILNTDKYTIIHTQNFPSKIYDYDYDSDNPNRRFLSTIVHHLRFLDNVTTTEILSLTFTHEIYEELVSSMIKMIPDTLDEKCNRDTKYSYGLPLVNCISNVFIDGSIIPGILIISKLNNSIKLSMSYNNIPIGFGSAILSLYDTKALIEMMNDDVNKVSNVVLQHG